MPTRKERCIEQIQQVKESHFKLMSEIDYALHGVEIEYRKPLGKRECQFGKWFYSSDLAKIILGPQMYEKLEQTHAQWHEIYAKVHLTIFPKNGIFGKLMQPKPSLEEVDKAKAYFDDLKKLTEEFAAALEVAQKRAQALSDTKFS